MTNPKIEPVGDSLNDPPFLDKVRLKVSERAEQQKYFEDLTRRPTTSGWKRFGKQYQKEKVSISENRI